MAIYNYVANHEPRHLVEGASGKLKWPNDILVNPGARITSASKQKLGLYGHLLNLEDKLACMENSTNIYFNKKLYCTTEEKLVAGNLFKKQNGKVLDLHHLGIYKNVEIEKTRYSRFCIWRSVGASKRYFFYFSFN